MTKKQKNIAKDCKKIISKKLQKSFQKSLQKKTRKKTSAERQRYFPWRARLGNWTAARRQLASLRGVSGLSAGSVARTQRRAQRKACRSQFDSSLQSVHFDFVLNFRFDFLPRQSRLQSRF